MDTLTPKQARFIQEYLIDLNPTRAYIRAGYSVKSEAVAMAAGSRLLSNVKVAVAIAEAKQARAARTNITQDKVLRELARLGFTDMRDYIEWGPDGVTLKSSSELTADQAAAVIEVTELRNNRGAVSGVRFRLADKQAALHDLGEHVGLFPKVPLINNRTIIFDL